MADPEPDADHDHTDPGAGAGAGAGDTNAAVWQSSEAISRWVATTDERERHRVQARRMMAEFLPFDVADRFTVVNLGAGTGAATSAVLARFPNASAVLADYSPHMMAQGTEALAHFEGRYRYVTFDLAAGAWPDELAGNLDAVVSSLCVHHLPDLRKGELFAEIAARLSPGAWYFNYDPVAPDDPVAESHWQRVLDGRDPAAAEARQHRSAEEHVQWENHVRHILRLGPQLEMLRRAGFDGVDVYWRELDHVIYGGRRPLEAR